MGIKEYFGDWLKAIDIKELNKVVASLNTLYKKTRITPSYNNVFKAFTLCSLSDLKAVFIGQDPYFQSNNIATGLAFANHKGTDKLSPSLQVLKDACTANAPAYANVKFDETLESWAKQGILLLNSALTTEVGKIGSHMNLWRPFISSLLKNLSKQETGIVYVLFGKQAETFKPYIDERFNEVIITKHPAYYVRTRTSMPSSLFENINKLINGKYGKPFKWYNLI